MFRRRTPNPTARHNPAAAGHHIEVVHRRADQIAAGNVVILPELVYLPERAVGAGRTNWTWREWRSAQLANAHGWRWVYDVNELAPDPADIGECVSDGFVLVRVSDDQPNQGGESNDLIVCLRELDLVAVQVEQPAPGQRPDAVWDSQPESSTP